MKMSVVRRLTECAMLVALATGLSMIQLVKMPYGGSVTAASMLPIVLIAFRHGTKYGVLSGCLYGVIQQLLGLSSLSYVTGWVSVLAVILLDYVLAFAMVGMAGVFRRTRLSQSAALSSGALLGSFLRYGCHVLSGATVWAGLSIPSEAALLYSLGYNAAYLLPETGILVCCAVYVGASVDFRSVKLSPLYHRNRKTASSGRVRRILRGVFSFVLCAAFVALAVTVSPHLQNEDGVFDLSGWMHVPSVPFFSFLSLFLVSLIGFVLTLTLPWRNSDTKEEK